MTELIVRYPVLFFSKKIRRMIPDSWEEMNSTQLMAVCRIISRTSEDFILFLANFSGISKSILNKISAYALYQLAEKTAFITNKHNLCAIFIISKIEGTRFIAPKHKLEGMAFGQFIFAESYYRDWITQQKDEQLFKFIASLYLKRGEKFNQEMIAGRIKRLKRKNIELFKAIAFNYSMVMNWLGKSYPLIFKERDDEEVENGKIQERSGWIKCFNSIVGDDLIHRDQYAELPVHVVLRYMTGKYLENIKH